MKILFTGGSSFTGSWFIQELAAAGHDVTAIFRKRLEEYPDDVRRQRVALACRVGACRSTAARSAMSRSWTWSERGMGPPLPPRGRRHQLQEPRFRHDRRRPEQHQQPARPCFGPSKAAGCGKVLLYRQRLRGGRGRGLPGAARLLPLRPVQGLDRRDVPLLLRLARAEPRQVRHPQPLRPLRGAQVHRLPDEELAGRRDSRRAPAPPTSATISTSPCWRRPTPGSPQSLPDAPGSPSSTPAATPRARVPSRFASPRKCGHGSVCPARWN